MHALYLTGLALSAALAVTAMIFSFRRRHVAALAGFSSALAARAAAFTFRGHYDLWGAVACAALLVTAVVIGMLRKPDAAARTRPGCGGTREAS